jgi:O-antigen ligase
MNSTQSAELPRRPLRQPTDPGSSPPLSNRERWAFALLAVSGCVFLPLALDRFVFPKLAVAALGVLIGTTTIARGRLPRGAWWVCFAGGLLLLVAALTGATPVAQLLGRPPRYEGILVLPVYLGVLATGARLLGSGRAPGATSWFLRWLSLAAIAICIEAILESAGLRPLASDVARPGSLLGNASDEGAWAVLALGPLTAVALRVGGRLRIAGALAAAIIVVCSGSRGALLGVVAVAIVLIVLTPKPGLRVLLALGVALIAVGVFTLPETRSRVLGESPLATQTARGRELVWTETLHLVADKPVFGAGPSGYLDAIPAYHDHEYEQRIGPQDPPESPHNVILQAASAGGVLLALLLILLAGLTARSGLRARKEQETGGEEAFFVGMLAGLIGYGVTLLFLFTTPGSTPLAALMAGALLSIPIASNSSLFYDWLETLQGLGSKLAPSARRVWQLALAVLVVVFTAAAIAEIPMRSAISSAATDHFQAANKDFRLAQDLRPWDGNVSATAAHAYAALVKDGISTAAGAGATWSTEELQAYPDWVQALVDGATIDAARHKTHEATQSISRALMLDPDNLELQANQ